MAHLREGQYYLSLGGGAFGVMFCHIIGTYVSGLFTREIFTL